MPVIKYDGRLSRQTLLCLLKSIWIKAVYIEAYSTLSWQETADLGGKMAESRNSQSHQSLMSATDRLGCWLAKTMATGCSSNSPHPQGDHNFQRWIQTNKSKSAIYNCSLTSSNDITNLFFVTPEIQNIYIIHFIFTLTVVFSRVLQLYLTSVAKVRGLSPLLRFEPPAIVWAPWLNL